MKTIYDYFNEFFDEAHVMEIHSSNTFNTVFMLNLFVPKYEGIINITLFDEKIVVFGDIPTVTFECDGALMANRFKQTPKPEEPNLLREGDYLLDDLQGKFKWEVDFDESERTETAQTVIETYKDAVIDFAERYGDDPDEIFDDFEKDVYAAYNTYDLNHVNVIEELIEDWCLDEEDVPYKTISEIPKMAVAFIQIAYAKYHQSFWR